MKIMHIQIIKYTLACNHSAKCLKFFARVFSPTDRLHKASNTFFHDFSVLPLSNHSVNISIQAALLFLASCWMVFRSFGLTPNCKPISNHLVAMLGITSSVSCLINTASLSEPVVLCSRGRYVWLFEQNQHSFHLQFWSFNCW